MIKESIICITIVVLAIIGLVAYCYRLASMRYERRHNIEDIDDKIYRDRLRILKHRFEIIKDSRYEEDDSIPEEIRQLLCIVDAIINNLY